MNQTLKLGCESGLDVMTWQKILVRDGAPIEVDCQFGQKTHDATIWWQKSHKLVADGVVGPVTWAAAVPEMALRSARKAAAFKNSLVSEKAIEIAITREGYREEGNNRGEYIDSINKDLGVPEGSPWCMSFVQSCFKLAAKLIGQADTLKPDTASCFGLWDNLGKGPCEKIGARYGMRGDVAIFSFSHTGIVLSYNGAGVYETIEGNTGANGEREGKYVARKQRKWTEIRGFVRVPDQEIG